MPVMKYQYREKSSKIFGTILRPLINIEVFSETKKD